MESTEKLSTYSKYFDLFYDGKINDISNKFGDNINLLKESVLINNSNFTNYNNFYIEYFYI